MSAKSILIRTGQLLLLSALYLLFFMLGGLLHTAVPLGQTPAEQQWMLFPALCLVSLVNSYMVMLVIQRSLWRGWRLMLGVGVSLYGVMTFMSQIETAWFGPALGVPAAMLPGLFMSSLPIVLGFIPIAAWMLGKAQPWNRNSEIARLAYARLRMPAPQWAWKLALIAVAYVVFYFAFGFLVAWQNPALRNMYGNGSNAEVFNYWILVPLQLLRGCCGPSLHYQSSPWIAAPAGKLPSWLGLAGAPMNIVHAIPNPIMPDVTVRLSHFIETSTSNFLFGMLLTGLILWRPQWRTRHAADELAARIQPHTSPVFSFSTVGATLADCVTVTGLQTTLRRIAPGGGFLF
ncbi:MAG: hypothetical protein IPK16_07045 [Anaerolineales bacterium]|nr:hypothetical protein [Anaerolineales bacterium]